MFTTIRKIEIRYFTIKIKTRIFCVIKNEKKYFETQSLGNFEKNYSQKNFLVFDYAIFCVIKNEKKYFETQGLGNFEKNYSQNLLFTKFFSNPEKVPQNFWFWKFGFFTMYRTPCETIFWFLKCDFFQAFFRFFRNFYRPFLGFSEIFTDLPSVSWWQVGSISCTTKNGGHGSPKTWISEKELIKMYKNSIILQNRH